MIMYVFAFIAVVFAVLYNFPRADIPAHLLGHPGYSVDQIVPDEAGAIMNKVLRDMVEYPTNTNADMKTGFLNAVEDIGETQPIGADGKCENPVLIPNRKKDGCIFPGRIDVGKHFIMTGGPDAIRENVADMTTRVQSFGRYMTGDAMEKYPIFNQVFNSSHFLNAAKTICPHDHQVLDPFQFNFLIQIPGQTVATHIDAPYFWGASRQSVPQWVLAAMVFSGLFDKLFINQVQVVSYLHTWRAEDVMKANNIASVGGDFVVYSTADGHVSTMASAPLSGNLVDGSKSIHAATVYRPDKKAPFINKNHDVVLRYAGDEKWQLMDLTDNTHMADYTSDDLRISLVYRARCFESDQAKAAYKEFPSIPIEKILAIFKADLIKNHKMTEEKLMSMTRFDLGLMIMNTYIKYPLPSIKEAIIPFNYCALPMLLPWTAPLIKLVCA